MRFKRPAPQKRGFTMKQSISELNQNLDNDLDFILDKHGRLIVIIEGYQFRKLDDGTWGNSDCYWESLEALITTNL